MPKLLLCIAQWLYFLPLAASFAVTTPAITPIRNSFSLLASSASSENDSNTASTTTTIQTKGSVVTIECCLRPDGEFIPEPLFDGICMEKYDKPRTLSFVLGEGNYLPGLHELVSSMNIGDTTEERHLDAGWGERNPNLEAWIEFETSAVDKSQIEMGTKLMLANGLKAVVTEIQDDKFKIDANPPMAGASYLASVKLVKVEEGPKETVYPAEGKNDESRFEIATIALGCFWGVELEYMREPGVVGTKVGYTQGDKQDPTYQEVCSGSTGHTEAMMVKYDPDVVSFERLVHLAMDRLGESKYFKNQVGNDVGTQYRHGIYYHTDEQKEVAEKIVKSYEGCVTEVLPAAKFWQAEEYHQQYLLKGGQSARKEDKSVIRCYG